LRGKSTQKGRLCLEFAYFSTDILFQGCGLLGISSEKIKYDAITPLSRSRDHTPFLFVFSLLYRREKIG
jgi:hypothetical protein